jgi:hypothetical protein
MKFIYKLLAILVLIVFFVALYFVNHILNMILGPLTPLLSSLSPVAKIIMAILFVIGLNVLAYFASYVWGQRKPWFFWLCLCMTIVAFYMAMLAL